MVLRKALEEAESRPGQRLRALLRRSSHDFDGAFEELNQWFPYMKLSQCCVTNRRGGLSSMANPKLMLLVYRGPDMGVGLGTALTR
jgi:hypothetical protein